MSLHTHRQARPPERLAELEAKVQELELLNELAVEAGRSRSTDALLNFILDHVMKALGAEQGTILTARKSEEGGLTTLIRQDDCSRIRKGLHIGGEIAGYVLYHRAPVLIEDLARDKRFAPKTQEKLLVHSVVCVPLIHGEELLGALMMVNRKDGGSFRAHDQLLLETIAGQVGQLLTNLRLQEHAESARAEAMRAHLEAEKQHEINELKSRLFANITHELMSPLAVVLGSLELLPARAAERALEEEVRVMRRNILRLQRLIGQLLDLAKLDAGQITISAQRTDAVGFVGTIVRSFTPLAERNGVTLLFNPMEGDLKGYMDRDLTEKILSNILSNAFKWTPPGGEIVVGLTREPAPQCGLSLTVSDTGSGIAPEHLEHIFTRYHRGDPMHSGFGIGLAFVKDLVELLRGTVAVASEPGSGTTVSIRLPLSRDAFGEGELLAAQEGDEREPEGHPSTTASDTAQGLEAVIRPAEPLLLIVEDSADLRRYLCEELNATYTVLEAPDGESGVGLALERIPDLVVCDVMMPGIDGCEVCRRLKIDERTSHIPVILLTGRTLGDDRIRGFEVGADDYVAKPCDMLELKVRINNLLEGRKALGAKYGGALSLPIAEDRPPSADERFLGRVREAVEQRMADAHLETASLARELAMSRMQLNRKLHALTGRSTHDFIRHLRLVRAAEMLRTHSGTVTEIAYAVGFNNLSHFAVAFRQEYGSRPSDYAARRARGGGFPVSPPPGAP
jgi:signal transduction histidine kinase/DNA-binding response OmpR family regulator